MEITRHFTATTFIVYRNKVLLHFHKKLQLWLPAGGHIERDEIPETAALREVKEEVGIDVILHQEPKKSNDELIRPMHILLENINEFHQHIDFIYYCFLEKIPKGINPDFEWFSLDKIRKLDAPDNVKEISEAALQLDH